jgi:hypothetical protein
LRLRFSVAKNHAVGHSEPVTRLQLRLMTIALALSLNLLDSPAASPAAATPLGTNLLVNGDAEAGDGSLSGSDVLPVPGWTTTNNFTVVSYSVGGGFPAPDAPGPAERRHQLLRRWPKHSRVQRLSGHRRVGWRH